MMANGSGQNPEKVSKKRKRSGRQRAKRKAVEQMTSVEIWGENTVSKNSLKTGRKQGNRSKGALEAKRIRRAGQIDESRRRAEGNWQTYVINTCPGELIKCKNDSATVLSKLVRFNLNESGYLKEVGKAHIPCPPLAYDSTTEKAFLLDLAQHRILSGIKPSFLLHKFENVLSLESRNDLLLRWADFQLTRPNLHNTKASSSSRSSSSSSYHLGIWRRMASEPDITSDTKCDGEVMRMKKCLDFLRLVKNTVATKIRELLQKYAKEEWAAREEMRDYIASTGLIKDFPELDFLGAFTSVAVTNGGSNNLHIDKNDGGLTWVVPLGDWEGADLCIPQEGIRVEVRPGDVVAFQANFLAHFNSQILSGRRLALTFFTDRNILFPVTLGS